MHINVLKYACCVALILGLAGCGNGVQLKTNVFPSPQKQPERIFVILTAPPAWADNVKTFTDAFSAQMQRCGTQTHVFFDTPKPETLSLDDDKNTARDQIIREEAAFTPDTVMSIHWASAQSALNGNINAILFNVALVWRAPFAGLPWQGTANVPAGNIFQSGGGAALASAIYDDLKQKKLLPACPVTTN